MYVRCRMHYSDTIRDHFEHPRHCGTLGGATVTAECVNGTCLDRLRLYLRIEAGNVAAAAFQAEGCVPALAAGSFLAEHATGRSVDELRALTAAELEAAMGGLPRAKRHATQLAVETLQRALDQLSEAHHNTP